MSTLNNGDLVGSYRIQSLIKQNEYTETFKAINENDNFKEINKKLRETFQEWKSI